jgi:hydrogenase nickel incorporation protein HypA/HybF
MHEYGVCEGVLDAVRARARGRRVAAIRVRFGVWHAVDAASLADAFESVAAGTEAADAAIDLVTVPARLTCRGCGSSADSTDLRAVCPRCASTDVELAGGDEMTLESVTYLPEPTGTDAT